MWAPGQLDVSDAKHGSHILFRPLILVSPEIHIKYPHISLIVRQYFTLEAPKLRIAILYSKMIGEKKFPFRFRRKSFAAEDLKVPDQRRSGVFGNNLGFWMTCYLGFQTLGSIYGMDPEKKDRSNNHRRYRHKPALCIYRVGFCRPFC